MLRRNDNIVGKATIGGIDNEYSRTSSVVKVFAQKVITIIQNGPIKEIESSVFHYIKQY